MNLNLEGKVAIVTGAARGTHKGDFMGIAPTGKQFELSGIAIGRVIGGKEVETWDVNDTLGVMQQLVVVPKKFS